MVGGGVTLSASFTKMARWPHEGIHAAPKGILVLEQGGASMKIGFLGLGNMGGPMALNMLKKSGMTVVVYDPNPQAMAVLIDAGARAAGSPKEVGDEAEVVFASLRPLTVNVDAALGKNGVIEGSAVRIYVELSTIGQKVVDRLVDGFKGSRITLVDAPVSGAVRGAVAGTLASMMAGPAEAFKEVEPFMKAICKEVYYVGEKPGLGQVCKLVNNAISNAAMTSTAEALVVGTKAGIDSTLLLEIINASTGRNSHSVHQFPGQVLTRNFKHGAYLENGLKDLSLYCDLGHDLGVPVWVGTSVTEVRRAAVAHLEKGADISKLILFYEHLAGIEVKGKEVK